MPLESSTTIGGLDKSYPLTGDPAGHGANHLRLIKQVLKDQFPGASGGGFTVAITASETELNLLGGLTSNIQEQLDSLDTRVDVLETMLSAPSGTRMVFNQPAVPEGWTQDASLADNSMMRIVEGEGGGEGGNDSPISFAHSHTTEGHTLTIDEIPSHTHAVPTPGSSGSTTVVALHGNQLPTGTISTTAAGGGQSHSHGDTSEVTWNPRYVDMIVGVAD